MSIEVNAALQHARKVLYRPNLLGEPKALHIKSTPGFLGVWFHRQTVGWPLSTGDGGAASMAFKKAYVQGESSIVTLDSKQKRAAPVRFCMLTDFRNRRCLYRNSIGPGHRSCYFGFNAIARREGVPAAGGNHILCPA